jgi:hypothetical protein
LPRVSDGAKFNWLMPERFMCRCGEAWAISAAS